MLIDSKPLKEALEAAASLVSQHIDELLPKEFSDSRLVEAMRYSSLSQGKRIRPFLLIASANIFGVNPLEALNTAAAIELVHTYSLIHDDLPAMDDDDLRRGEPTCHKKFDEATAILAGDALLTYAFELLAAPETNKDAATRCQLISILAKASGFNGMAGGQMMDLEKARQKISKETVAKLHRLKTGELFMAAAEMGAALGNAGLEQRKALRYFAHDLGLAFQIKDDILDHAEIAEGKTEIDENPHEESQENASIVDIVGLEQAKQQLELLKNQAISHLGIFGERATLLADLTDFVVGRKV